MEDGARNEAGTDEAGAGEARKVCGIVMPIAAMGGDYPEDHWRRVRKVLDRAIVRAGLRPQLVWESAEIDVIQARILQNLYENDVVICDVSGLNPNVMFETGLRLSTRKPTIIVTDEVHKPPFDIQDIHYIAYPKDLEYNATDKAIGQISDRIREVIAAGAGYKPYIANFRFETVTPSTVSVTSEQFLQERLDELTVLVRRIESAQASAAAASPSTVATAPGRSPRWVDLAQYTFRGTFREAKDVENRIDQIDEAICHLRARGGDRYELLVRRRTDVTYDILDLKKQVDAIVFPDAGAAA